MATWQEMSQDCLRSAKLLLSEEQWRGSVNRSYYAAYCAVSGKLKEHGVRFAHGWNNPAHEQLPALIHNGLPLPQNSRRQLIQALRRLRYARENADYRPPAPVDHAVALACIHDATLVVRPLERQQ